MLTNAQKVLLVLAAMFYVTAGTFHFLNPSAYTKIMPPHVLWHLAMVYVSGAAEIAGGLGLLLPKTRRLAAWCLVALLIAVFPANIYMAVNQIQVTSRPLPPSLLWARLPVQALLIWWVLWCTNVRPPSR